MKSIRMNIEITEALLDKIAVYYDMPKIEVSAEVVRGYVREILKNEEAVNAKPI